MRLRLLLPALAAMALLPATSAGAATAKNRCDAKGAKTVVKSRFVRVFKAPGRAEDSTGRLFGCMYSNGKRVLLDEGSDDGLVTSEAFRRVVLNGRFVAWEHESVDLSCKAECPPGYETLSYTIHSRDLRSRKTRTFSGKVAQDSLDVGKLGTPVWVQSVGDLEEVHAGDSVLDTGNIIGLRLSGTTLEWLNETSGAKTATVR
jgi:hypothetical protein